MRCRPRGPVASAATVVGLSPEMMMQRTLVAEVLECRGGIRPDLLAEQQHGCRLARLRIRGRGPRPSGSEPVQPHEAEVR